MPINVVCPGCKKRFNVSDKYAGQKGPCPSCKAEITIPAKGDEVVIHAPEPTGPKDSKGRSLSKPILREETKFSKPLAIGIGLGVVTVLVVAIVLRSMEEPPPVVIAMGALLLAPAAVWGGYSVLHNDELEPYRGKELWARVAACSAAYAFLWLAYWWIPWVLELEQGFSFTQLAFVVPPMVLAGGFAAFAALDLDYAIGLLHYGFYLLITVALCLVIGVQLYAPAS